MGKVSNEQLCAALITHSSIKEAAGALNVSEKTIYNMMSTTDFISMYADVQRKILSGSILTCQSRMVEAINCISDIMADKEANPQIRLLAAQTILKNSIAMMEISDSIKKREKRAAEWGNNDPLTDYDYEDGL